jgi:uncharacterized membrane protein
MDRKKVKNEIIDEIDAEFIANETFGETIADKVAEIGGSWSFIIFFFAVMIGWCALNSFEIFVHPIDPFPYSFLNLFLSCVAAIQCPIIMMSNNRSSERDRIKANLDLTIDSKNEIEIKKLHDKVDHLIKRTSE